MTVNNPKITGDPVEDSWAFEVTNQVNDLEVRVEDVEENGGGIQSGATLPTTGTLGDAFVLTDTDGTNNPGLYYYTIAWNADGGGNGAIGPRGPAGATGPVRTVGDVTVNTLDSDSDATVSIQAVGDGANYTFGIPRGMTGERASFADVVKLEAVSEGVPVPGDFTGNILLIGQY